MSCIVLKRIFLSLTWIFSPYIKKENSDFCLWLCADNQLWTDILLLYNAFIHTCATCMLSDLRLCCVQVKNSDGDVELQPVFSKGLPIPARKHQTFALHGNQNSFCLEIYESDTGELESARLLAKVNITEYQNAQKEHLQVCVIFGHVPVQIYGASGKSQVKYRQDYITTECLSHK